MPGENGAVSEGDGSVKRQMQMRVLRDANLNTGLNQIKVEPVKKVAIVEINPDPSNVKKFGEALGSLGLRSGGVKNAYQRNAG